MNSKKKKLSLLLISAVVLVAAVLLLTQLYIRPANDYKKALAAIDSGDYLQADTLLQKLGDYKDAAQKRQEIAQPLKWAQTQAAQVGSYVFFGSYEQDNNSGNGAEDIEWLVLDRQGGKLLLISKMGLDCVPYHTEYTDVTWENCSMRAWLNTDFYQTAFDEQQKQRVLSTELLNEDNPTYSTHGGNSTTDKVFLLSVSEAQNYFADDKARQALPTAVTEAKGAISKNPLDKSCWWYLRTPGINHSAAANVYGAGAINMPGNDVNYSTSGVRPVFWLDIS